MSALWKSLLADPVGNRDPVGNSDPVGKGDPVGMNNPVGINHSAGIVLPWFGGRAVFGGGRRWSLQGPSPDEQGWHRFEVDGGRRARWRGVAEVDGERLEGYEVACGYLVGDRLIPDGARVAPDPRRIVEQTLKVELVEPGLDRFCRVRAVKYEGVAWVYARQEFPLGPEGAVLEVFLDRGEGLGAVPGVTPALDLSFQFERFRRDQAEARRRAIEARAQAEAARAAAEARRRQAAAMVGTGEGRRRLAAHDFEAAARAALRVSGSELLDHRATGNKGEVLVRFRFAGQRFECVVDGRTLGIIDSGICLVDHATGEKGDTYFTLESLPVVIEQARREGRLVIFRHVR